MIENPRQPVIGQAARRRYRIACVAAVLAAALSGCVSEPHGGAPRAAATVLATRPAEDPILHVGGAEIRVTLPNREMRQLTDPQILHWIEAAANAVSGYLGRFPVRDLHVVVTESPDDKVNHGAAFKDHTIGIRLGRDTTPADLKADWEMTHEMFHLGFPSLDENHHWMEEGLSDYLEPIARARAGQLKPAEVWSGFVEGMPEGQPRPGDRGLNHTGEWGRVYWGGATYWLLADVRIRQQTHGKKSLNDAIRAILAAGGEIAHDWPVERVLETGDRATGTAVLKDLHDELGEKPVTVDLQSLWKQLGISEQRGEVRFDDHAPLADIRRGITQGR